MLNIRSYISMAEQTPLLFNNPSHCLVPFLIELSMNSILSCDEPGVDSAIDELTETIEAKGRLPGLILSDEAVR